ETIVEIVKENGPITGEKISSRLNLSRATIRPDLAILTMAGFLDARPRVGYFYTGKTGSELLTEKVKKYKVKDFKSVTVVVIDDHSCLIGVLSRKDLLRASLGKQELTSVPVHIIMTRMPNITVCKPNDLLIESAKKLINKQIDGLPVVKESKNGLQVVGRITKTTITQAFVELTLG